jgi:hypothetical protein
MKRYVLLAGIFFRAIAQTGCAGRRATRGVVTPWGAAAIHTIRPAAVHEPDDRALNAEVARLLDPQDSSGTFVAAR